MDDYENGGDIDKNENNECDNDDDNHDWTMIMVMMVYLVSMSGALAFKMYSFSSSLIQG